MRTPTAAFSHRPKTLFGVVLASEDGGGVVGTDVDIVGDIVGREIMVSVGDEVQNSDYASDDGDDIDLDWEPPPNTPDPGGPSAAPVDPAAVLARFREQVRDTLTPRGRADKRGTVSITGRCFSTRTLEYLDILYFASVCSYPDSYPGTGT
jgi:hypothetical protein